jgi:hypothetical protein
VLGDLDAKEHEAVARGLLDGLAEIDMPSAASVVFGRYKDALQGCIAVAEKADTEGQEALAESLCQRAFALDEQLLETLDSP